MITYKYRCNHCKIEFEVKQKMRDDKLKDCEHCKQTDSLERLINFEGVTKIGGIGVYANGTY